VELARIKVVLGQALAIKVNNFTWAFTLQKKELLKLMERVQLVQLLVMVVVTVLLKVVILIEIIVYGRNHIKIIEIKIKHLGILD